MFALPTWLACYISIGLGVALCLLFRAGARGFHNAFHAKSGRAPGYIACTIAVMAMTLAWPLLLVGAVVRR